MTMQTNRVLSRHKKALKHAICIAALMFFLIPQASCFGIIHEPARHFFVLHTDTQAWPRTPHFSGLLRVRDLDTDSPYDRLQLVLRRSPYELSYRSRELWAVKPARMVSDILARAFGEGHVFTASTRELGERRPDFLLAGELHALEVDDTDGHFLAHVSYGLQLTEASTGETLWTGEVDIHRPIPGKSYRGAVEQLSQVVSETSLTFARELLALKARGLVPNRQMGKTSDHDKVPVGEPTIAPAPHP